ncbi:hypothetical protein OG417_49635 [Actinoallomurus sp. NBC_01490]|jgi:hypothetical protein|uniref:hypothetical protein n=1 Tax=Actinoallomurus sp. NBC_01490 TaxID=2903557 RepID=UPI002E37E6E6|nr:hypothetical protein [Actinoallomurus sp. NBC_01490]
MTNPAEEPRKFFGRLPHDFYDMTEAEQLEWTREFGQGLKAAVDSDVSGQETRGENGGGN